MVMVKRRGFTLIELILVILIIGILASIMIVAYNGVQARARDAIRKNDIASLAKQIEIYATQNQTWNAACGDTTNTMSGYTNVTYGSNPTITSCLKSFDSSNKQLNDPSGCVSLTDTASTCNQSIRGAYAAYNTIATNSHYYLVAKLETLGSDQSMITNSDMDSTTKSAVLGAGFNYLLKVR